MSRHPSMEAELAVGQLRHARSTLLRLVHELREGSHHFGLPGRDMDPVLSLVVQHVGGALANIENAIDTVEGMDAARTRRASRTPDDADLRVGGTA